MLSWTGRIAKDKVIPTTTHPCKLWAGIFHRAPQYIENTQNMTIVIARVPPATTFMYRLREALIEADLSVNCDEYIVGFSSFSMREEVRVRVDSMLRGRAIDDPTGQVRACYKSCSVVEVWI